MFIAGQVFSENQNTPKQTQIILLKSRIGASPTAPRAHSLAPRSAGVLASCGAGVSPAHNHRQLPPHRHRFPHARVTGQLGRFVGRFPGEVGIAAPEVSVRRRLLENRAPQLQRFDNSLRG